MIKNKLYPPNLTFSDVNIYWLEIVWIIYLFIIQISMVPYPGTDLVNPQGFFGWYDQGQYLKIFNDFINFGLKNSNEWTYPFGYILLSTPLNLLINNSQVSIVFTNIILLIISYWIIRGFLKNHTKVILLISFIVLSYKFEFIRYAFFIPWSTSVTLTAFTICIFIHLSGKQNFISFILLGIINSFMFFCRPQDAVLLFIFNGLYIIMNISQKNILRNLLFFSVSAVIPILLSKIFYDKFLIGGSIYTSTQHAFLPLGIIQKIIALFNGDVGYGINSISLFNYSPLLYSGFLFLLIYGMVFLPFYFSASLICYLVIYLSFSDFGPHNFIVFQLFHYLKLPLLALFIIFIDKFNYLEYKKYLTICIIVYIFSFLSISYNNNLAECRSNVFNGEIISNCSTNDVVDIVYIEGFVKKFPNVYFDDSKLIINGNELLLYKDFRVFSGPQGIILYIFNREKIYDLKFKTINYSLSDNLNVYYYKRFGVLEW